LPIASATFFFLKKELNQPSAEYLERAECRDQQKYYAFQRHQEVYTLANNLLHLIVKITATVQLSAIKEVQDLLILRSYLTSAEKQHDLHDSLTKSRAMPSLSYIYRPGEIFVPLKLTDGIMLRDAQWQL
jgi:hypothetical protein